MSPILQASEHDLDPVAAFVAALVVLDGFAAQLPARDAGPYPLAFQRIPEPVGIITPVGQQPLRPWRTAQQGRRAGVIADLTCRHEEADRPSLGIRNRMQLGVHATLRAPDQTAPLVVRPSFFDRRLVAVRCAFK